MKKIGILFLVLSLFLPGSVFASLASDLSGKILLQVEANGEAWYVNPDNEQRYFMGRPSDAFALMRELGVGISNDNILRIQVAEANFEGADQDNDGLSDRIEDAFGTDKTMADTDKDGEGDFSEVVRGQNPLGLRGPGIDQSLSRQLHGKILLQVEANGEAWYVNPADSKRYFLGRPADAFSVMRNLGLGISNQNLAAISISENSAPVPEVELPITLPPQEEEGQMTSPANPETATYKVEFIATWSSNTHPGNYPSGAHFSPFVAYSHNGQENAQIFTSGGIATPGFEIMAETGGTVLLNEEVDQLIASDRAWEKVQGGVFNSPGSSERELTFTMNYNHFTFVSMIAPSPDWFVTQSGSLLQDGEWVERLELEVMSYDSGTDSGEAFTSADIDTNPKQAITKLEQELQGLGKIVLTRIDN